MSPMPDSHSILTGSAGLMGLNSKFGSCGCGLLGEETAAGESEAPPTEFAAPPTVVVAPPPVVLAPPTEGGSE